MMKYKKKNIAIAIIISTLFLQGCSSNANREAETKQTLSAISLNNSGSVNASSTTVAISEMTTNETIREIDDHQIDVDISNDTHTFVINSDVDNYSNMTGMIFTYDVPDKANVYRILSIDEDVDVFYNPINKWEMVSFQSLSLMRAEQFFNEDMTDYEQLSHDDINSIIDSITRINSYEFEQIDMITSSFLDSEWCDYLIKETFPAISSDMYHIVSWDSISGDEITIDTVRNRNLDLYVIKSSINGIPVGTSDDSGATYGHYDIDTEIESRIMNDYWYMFYDDTNIYEVHTGYHDTEIYLRDQPILSFDQAIEVAKPAIYSLIYESSNKKWDTSIYAAELVYLPTSDCYISSSVYMGEGSFSREGCEYYLYPFWVIYTHTNCVIAGTETAYSNPIFVNAITGEVFVDLNY